MNTAVLDRLSAMRSAIPDYRDIAIPAELPGYTEWLSAAPDGWVELGRDVYWRGVSGHLLVWSVVTPDVGRLWSGAKAQEIRARFVTDWEVLG